MRIVTTTLGPGIVRGDRFASSGCVRAGAHLIVAAQSSLRVHGPGRSCSAASWTVERGATLELIGEPVVPFPLADVHLSTNVELEEGGRVVLLDLVALRGSFQRLAVTTSVRGGGRLIAHDAAEIREGSLDTRVVGTLTIVGGPASWADEMTAGLDHIADKCSGVRLGIGALREGRGILVRALGDDAWGVRTALHTLRDHILVHRESDDARRSGARAGGSTVVAAGIRLHCDDGDFAPAIRLDTRRWRD